jgi:hypothetical protein
MGKSIRKNDPHVRFGGKADIGRTLRIGSNETGRNGTEIETDAESCMPGNADDASYGRARRPRREETESERGLHDEPRYNKERDREHQCGDERRP